MSFPLAGPKQWLCWGETEEGGVAGGFDNGKFQVAFQGPGDYGGLTLSPLIL